MTSDPHNDVYIQTVAHLGFMASCCCVFSPMMSMFKIMRFGASGKELVGLLVPYFLYFTQCFLWSFYGIFTNHMDIARINMLGTTMCLMYISIMANYAQPKDRKIIRPIVACLTAVLFITAFSVVMMINGDTRVMIFSQSATCFAVLLNVVPMVQILEVIKTRSTEGFPVALTAAGFLSCSLWSEYAIMIHDIPYLLPSLLGVLMNGIQIGVVCWVYVKQEMECMEQSEKQKLAPVLSDDRHPEALGDNKKENWAIGKDLSMMKEAWFGEEAKEPAKRSPGTTGGSYDLML